MSSSSNSSQLELVLKWHEALDKKDINLLTEPLHEEFRYVTHPQSLNMPESSKKKWCSQMAGAIRFWTEVNVSRVFLVSNRILSKYFPTEDHPFRHRSSGEGDNSRQYFWMTCGVPSMVCLSCPYLTVLRNNWDSVRGRLTPRSNHYRHRRNRSRGWESEDQEGRRVHRLQISFRFYGSTRGSESR